MDFIKTESRTLYEGKIMDLIVDKIRFENGNEAIREVARHKNAAAIVAVTPEGKILLVRQYRYAIEEDTMEIPAGLLEDGEEAITGACREMEEETGKKPVRMEHMFRFYSSPGFTTEGLDVYLCDAWEESRQHLDADEFIDLVEVSPEEILPMIHDGRITDGKTIAALSYYLATRSCGA